MASDRSGQRVTGEELLKSTNWEAKLADARRRREAVLASRGAPARPPSKPWMGGDVQKPAELIDETSRPLVAAPSDEPSPQNTPSAADARRVRDNRSPPVISSQSVPVPTKPARAEPRQTKRHIGPRVAAVALVAAAFGVLPKPVSEAIPPAEAAIAPERAEIQFPPVAVFDLGPAPVLPVVQRDSSATAVYAGLWYRPFRAPSAFFPPAPTGDKPSVSAGVAPLPLNISVPVHAPRHQSFDNKSSGPQPLEAVERLKLASLVAPTSADARWEAPMVFRDVLTRAPQIVSVWSGAADPFTGVSGDEGQILVSALGAPTNLYSEDLRPDTLPATGLTPPPLRRDVEVILFLPTRGDVERLSAAEGDLSSLGYDVKASNRVPQSISRAQVRFFYEADRAAAAVLAREMEADLRDFTNFETLAPSGRVELWLSGRGAPKPPAPEPSLPAPVLIVAPEPVRPGVLGLFQSLFSGDGSNAVRQRATRTDDDDDGPSSSVVLVLEQAAPSTDPVLPDGASSGTGDPLITGDDGPGAGTGSDPGVGSGAGSPAVAGDPSTGGATTGDPAASGDPASSSDPASDPASGDPGSSAAPDTTSSPDPGSGPDPSSDP